MIGIYLSSEQPPARMYSNLFLLLFHFFQLPLFVFENHRYLSAKKNLVFFIVTGLIQKPEMKFEKKSFSEIRKRTEIKTSKKVKTNNHSSLSGFQGV